MIRITVLLTCLVYSVLAAAQDTSSTTSPAKQFMISTKGDTIYIDGDDDMIFQKVEFESTFPGGIPGWVQFLNQNLTYPSKAVRKNVQGTVVLQFIVCTDGTVCDVEAISGPELLRKSAIEAIKRTPNWTPAVQNGKKVKSYKKQPIIFKLSN
jgi:protein TonB